MTTPDNSLPHGVNADLNDAKQVFLNEEVTENIDPLYNKVIGDLEKVLLQHDEMFDPGKNHYLFDQIAFVDSLGYIVEDQQSALKKEKISPKEFATRWNRWLVFCEAVINMGITCEYSRQALEKEDYATVFGTLRLNKSFEITFLKPRGITIAFRHKSPQIKAKFPWLCMPCLIVKDDENNEHEIAITPGPEAEVWWFNILTNFHNSYNWGLFQTMSLDGVGTSSIDSPYATLEEEDEDDDLSDEDDENDDQPDL